MRIRKQWQENSRQLQTFLKSSLHCPESIQKVCSYCVINNVCTIVCQTIFSFPIGDSKGNKTSPLNLDKADCKEGCGVTVILGTRARKMKTNSEGGWVSPYHKQPGGSLTRSLVKAKSRCICEADGHRRQSVINSLLYLYRYPVNSVLIFDHLLVFWQHVSSQN